MAPRFYEPSGGFKPVGVMVTLVAMLGVCFGAGFAYAYLSEWIPLIWLRFFFIIGLGFAVAFAVTLTGTYGKVRNRALMRFVALIVGAATVWFQWIAYFHSQSEPSVWIINPGHIFEILSRMAEGGVWEIFDWTPTGWALWTFWGIEAGIIMMAAFFGAGVMNDPYCEVTDDWADAYHYIQPLAVSDNPPAFARDVSMNPVAVLRDWPEPDDDDEPAYVRARLSYVKEQEERCTWFLALYTVTLSYDDDGDVQESEEQFMQHLIIDKRTADELLTI